MPERVIVFDVNETLLNVHCLEPLFQRIFGESSALKEWFSTLLLHSEVATLAGPYFDFGTLVSPRRPRYARGRPPRDSVGRRQTAGPARNVVIAGAQGSLRSAAKTAC